MKSKVMLVVLVASLLSFRSLASDEIQVASRHVRHYVRPNVPEMARQMNIKGSVKLQVEIAANGKVTSVKPLGGHPLLVDCASRAVMNWQFEPGSQASSGPVTIVFQ